MKIIDRINRCEATLLEVKILNVSLYSWLMFSLIVLGIVGVYMLITPTPAL